MKYNLLHIKWASFVQNTCDLMSKDWVQKNEFRRIFFYRRLDRERLNFFFLILFPSPLDIRALLKSSDYYLLRNRQQTWKLLAVSKEATTNY